MHLKPHLSKILKGSFTHLTIFQGILDGEKDITRFKNDPIFIEFDPKKAQLINTRDNIFYEKIKDDPKFYRNLYMDFDARKLEENIRRKKISEWKRNEKKKREERYKRDREEWEKKEKDLRWKLRIEPIKIFINFLWEEFFYTIIGVISLILGYYYIFYNHRKKH